ncbi:hypothetical protein QCA50_012648 [Cerrena zonata]|uniref:Alpha-type protein kinase domain-containing protein n=1 Tax=Cerrena zonata TaxID=2478898 RepID=A0AAW0G1R5_9APHY
MDAFGHFSLTWTKNTIVLADLQSTSTFVKTPLAGGIQRSCDVLFDVMSHSLAGSTGVGDHGRDGIMHFVQSHKCQTFCDGLGLEPLSEDDIEETALTNYEDYNEDVEDNPENEDYNGEEDYEEAEEE